jgi:hypothetical protein
VTVKQNNKLLVSITKLTLITRDVIRNLIPSERKMDETSELFMEVSNSKLDYPRKTVIPPKTKLLLAILIYNLLTHLE